MVAMTPSAMTAEFVLLSHQEGTKDTNQTRLQMKANNPRRNPQQVNVLKQ